MVNICFIQIIPADDQCLITLTYLGPEINIEYDREQFGPDGDEIIVMQQHCGGENRIVFKHPVKRDGSLNNKVIYIK